MSQPLVIFLNSEDHIRAWVEGGQIPLNLASSYYSVEAGGVMTPNENLICVDTTGVNWGPNINIRFERPSSILARRDGLPPGLYLEYGAVIETSMGRYISKGSQLTGKHEDGLILSLSDNATKTQMRRFGTKNAGVAILDLPLLRMAFDEQLKVCAISKKVRYTSRRDRNHFLKSKQDKWQSEFRLFWPIVLAEVPVWVTVPSGVAVPLNIQTLRG